MYARAVGGESLGGMPRVNLPTLKKTSDPHAIPPSTIRCLLKSFFQKPNCLESATCRPRR